MRYTDWPQGQMRAVQVLPGKDGRTLSAFILAGDTRAEAWLKPLLQEHALVDAFGRDLLAPGAEPPVAMVSKGKQVCTCFNVSEEAIRADLAARDGSDEQRLNGLQTQLQCGTNCGSCIPELRKIIQLTRPVAAI